MERGGDFTGGVAAIGFGGDEAGARCGAEAAWRFFISSLTRYQVCRAVPNVGAFPHRSVRPRLAISAISQGQLIEPPDRTSHSSTYQAWSFDRRPGMRIRGESGRRCRAPLESVQSRLSRAIVVQSAFVG